MAGYKPRAGRSRSKPDDAFKPEGIDSSAVHPHREACDGWRGDPYPTTHPYMGKDGATGPKYGVWMPHPYLTDMDTLAKRFGSWRGSEKMEIEPRVGVGNLRAERNRLGIGGLERGQVRYPPIGLCNTGFSDRPTLHPGHICNLDLSEDAKCPFQITLGKPNPDWPTVSRPGNPWYCSQRLRPEHKPGLPNLFQPQMPPAGISTSNDCPLAWRYHPSNLSDPNLKRVILQKTLGQFTNPNTFRPQPGDILILQRARRHPVRDAGFVQFYTAGVAQQTHLWNNGDHLVRLGKLIDGMWKEGKEFKLFKLIQKTTICSSVGRWMITGLMEKKPRELVPLKERRNYVLHTIVPGLWLKRGDLLVKSDASNGPSQLEWAVVPGTGPCYRPGHGDIILRAYVHRPRPPQLPGAMAGSVEMFLYDGRGAGWVFMGRDETVIDGNGDDLLEIQNSCRGN